MQSENFDKKVRDSLNQRPPGNDKPAWDKMEPLLDEHMPQEKKDRRGIFFILAAFILLGGGAFLIWQNNSEKKNDISSITSQDNSSPEKTNKLTDSDPTIAPNNIKEKSSGVKPAGPKDQSVISLRESGDETKTRSRSFKNPGPENGFINPSKAERKSNKTVYDPILSTTSPGKQEPIKKDEVNPNPAQQTIPNPTETTTVNSQDPVKKEEAQKSSVDNTGSNQKPETRGSQPTTAAKAKNEKSKPNRSFFDKLFFSVSTGADLSAVGMDNAGTIKPVIGAGIGYQVSNKFSIRTGFYSARKVYTAAPDEYHPPYNLQAAYPNLKNVDANCKVYEVPVMIDFNISNNKKRSWFASAGMSSLIMKEEVYDYYYKPVTSPTYITHRRTIKDQNKHYFSVLNLSGGYRKNINRNFSLQAEPYVKIATNGVGFGKVNLNSGGVLVSAIIKPFAKKL